MKICFCPYITNLLSKIPEPLLEDNLFFEDSFDFLVYPLGTYSVKNFDDICSLIDYLSEHIFSTSVQQCTLDRYLQIIIDNDKIPLDSYTIDDITLPDYKDIYNGKTLLCIMDFIFEEELLTQNKDNLDDIFVEYLSTTKTHFKNTKATYDEDGIIDYNDIFTVMWSLLVMLNSLVNSDNSESQISLNLYDFSITEIVQKCREYFIMVNKNRNPLITMQEYASLIDLNDIPDTQKDFLDAAQNSCARYQRLEDYKYLMYESYFECLLIVSYYYAKNENLI